ncbi:MAG: UDP-N-acetylmuramoyl-L-alanyl-D-glutamate--2,6-diaminopimelate ligase [Candidatus Magasanikbacteria bacterium]|nr:UDP-N-acetylmuramoyl-L-alanyl-D-glutamate--2,6-diaminopimelate ligase [Candidatus Magasanikbacteria bacterium]
MNVFLRLYHWKLAWLAYLWYGRPSKKLIVVGVTGTKGKSSACRFIASVLEAGGYKVGMLSTVEFQIGDKRWPNDKKMTMLGRGQIQKMLRGMVRAGCQYAVVETSSEGILQYRHIGLNYDVAVFTNLGTEHSERHGGFENLRRDKGKIFAGLKKYGNKKIGEKIVEKIIIANIDDANAEYFLQFPADRKISYGIILPNADIRGHIVESTIAKTIFTVDGKKYEANVPAAFNVYNSLAAMAVAKSQGVSDDKIYSGLSSVRGIPGRMEFIEEGQPYKVVVDYAHEPMSLAELFSSLRRFVGNKQKIISVIGSDGGGRDKLKRAEMGRIAGEMTDMVIIADVNCFDEDPMDIAEMIAVGARNAGKKDGTDMLIEIDRKIAIEKALEIAEPGDVVAITAKGTEPFIAVSGGKKIPWDDRTVAREAIEYVATKKN